MLNDVYFGFWGTGAGSEQGWQCLWAHLCTHLCLEQLSGWFWDGCVAVCLSIAVSWAEELYGMVDYSRRGGLGVDGRMRVLCVCASWGGDKSL